MFVYQSNKLKENLQILQSKMSYFLSVFSLLVLMASFNNPVNAFELVSHSGKSNISTYTIDGTNVPALMSWELEPGDRVDGVILAIHGFSLHKGSYSQFAKALNQKGFVTYAIDIRGFGSWNETKQKRLVALEKGVNDTVSVLKQLRKKYPGNKIFLVGESMGGALAIQVASRFPKLVDGLITSVPSFQVKGKKRSTISVLIRLLFHRNSQIDLGDKIVSLATSDSQLKTNWKNDPYSRLKVSAKELFNYAKFMRKNKEAARKIVDLPVLFLQGSDDRLIKPRGNKELFSEISSFDKELVVMDSYEHLIFEKGQFQKDIVNLVSNWIDGQRKILLASNI